MLNIKSKIAAASASAVILSGVFANGAFAADLQISGNGAGSNNKIEVSSSNETVVEQGNAMIVVTAVSSSANTGGNNASGNTGKGDVTIDTGNATSTVTTTVTGGGNEATLPEGCGCPDDATVKISGNGKNSTNKVKKSKSDSTYVGQGNFLGVGTFVSSKAKTGKNKAKNNTGKGAVDITTGTSNSKVTTTVTGGGNVLN